ncbi:MAG TPA: branched-chain amino acid ABC transporter permease [Thermoplasmata archaeon]|nr:branched-chain amino acid ABC transporter permease [Thermoplasmata archaeon]
MSAVPAYLVELANFLIPAAIFALLALGLNIQWGHTGLFNGGVAAFFGIGAYTAAILMSPFSPATRFYPGHLGGFAQSFPVAAIGAMVVAGLAGLLIAIPVLRLRADYFAISTLALAEIVRLTLTNARSWTGGAQGIILIPRPFEVPGDYPLSTVYLAGLVALILLLALWLLEFLGSAPWGRVLRGIREDEEATLALGKNVYSFRLQAFVIGCVLMGLAGAVFATYRGFVAPTQFDPAATFTIYVMVILGGSGNNKGVIIGSFLFYAFDWISVRVDDKLPDELALRMPYIRLMLIGALLVALVVYRPEGLFRERKRTFRAVRKP